MPFTIEQRSKIVKFYLETKSLVQTQREYRKHFGVKEAPSVTSIKKIVQKFEVHGTCHNRNKGNSGRRVSARTELNIDTVRESTVRSPKKSIRRRSSELGLTKSTVQRILKQDLNLYPYKLEIKQTLTDRDKEQRFQMCTWFNEMMENDEHWVGKIWFSDEAHFHLDGSVNRRNCRIWGTEPPNVVTTKSLHSRKCTAWCALSSDGIIGPYWFEDNAENAVTVKQENYRHVIKKFTACLRGRRFDLKKLWFQQDGATPHTAVETRKLLSEKFEDRLISLKASHIWAPHSPDLSPLDFFLWGYAKDNVYKNKPTSISELKQEITTFMRAISADTCKAVIQNFAVRVRECLLHHGDHIEHVI